MACSPPATWPTSITGRRSLRPASAAWRPWMRSGFWTRASSLGGRGAAKKQVRLQSQGPALAPPPATAGGGWEGVPRFEASPKAPHPNPSVPPATLAAGTRRASQWHTSATNPHLPLQGQEKEIADDADSTHTRQRPSDVEEQYAQ